VPLDAPIPLPRPRRRPGPALLLPAADVLALALAIGALTLLSARHDAIPLGGPPGAAPADAAPSGAVAGAPAPADSAPPDRGPAETLPASPGPGDTASARTGPGETAPAGASPRLEDPIWSLGAGEIRAGGRRIALADLPALAAEAHAAGVRGLVLLPTATARAADLAAAVEILRRAGIARIRLVSREERRP